LQYFGPAKVVFGSSGTHLSCQDYSHFLSAAAAIAAVLSMDGCRSVSAIRDVDAMRQPALNAAANSPLFDTSPSI
jgi:hypothetical protein